jgi:TonB-linked SusC/RagA family outer membrane protein
MTNKLSNLVSPRLLMMGMTMAALLTPLQIFSQNLKTVKGTVLDENGEPLVGATVKVPGTQNGAVTDLDGHFSVSVPANVGQVKVSYLGYKEYSAKVGAGNLSVHLTPDNKSISEVVVVGYGTQKKANLTGSVASVSSKEISSIPVANTAALLQGRLPGVTLTSNGGQAGADSPEIRIRGVGTFGNNNPMLLIDGVEAPIGQLAELAPGDIDNISVLKDAASAAIYGVRAANGVILVTTKRGGNTAPSISYNGSYSIQSATVKPKYVNSYEWAKMYNESNNTQTYTQEMLDKLRDGSDPDHFANTDWWDALFRTAPMTQHSLSVSGGSNKAHYMMSVGYLKQEGIMEHTGYERFNFRSNTDAELGRVKIGLNLSGSKENITANGGMGGDNGLMRSLTWFTRPTVPVMYSNGYYGNQDGSDISFSKFKNPIEMMSQVHNKQTGWRFDGQVYGEVNIVKGLKFRSSLAYKLYVYDASWYNKRSRKYNAEGDLIYKSDDNSLTANHKVDYGYVNENILTYDQRFGLHHVNALLGHSIQENHDGSLNGSKQGFATDNLYQLDAGTRNPQAWGNATEYSLQSFFGRVGYNYDDRYLAEFNIRHDGSSRMPKSHRYATFPSVSGGWIVTNEKFFPQNKVMNYLKLRASWGKLGNQEIGDYAYEATMAANYNYHFGNTASIGMAENMVANSDIKWETTTMTDIGLDASFWGSRISLTFDYYNKMTSDILMQLTMPTTFLGSLAAPTQNAGKVRNRGIELSANYQDHAGDFTWQVGGSLSTVQNRIIDNHGIDNISGNTINREGNPIGSYYGLRAIGIYRTEEDLKRTNSKGEIIKPNGLDPQLGDIMYEDVNDDGKIDDNDRVIIGNPFPKLTYSINAALSWRHLDFSMLWQGVSGVDRFNWEQATITNGGNMTTRWLDRWSADNPNGSMPRLGNNFNERYSSFWLDDASYLRLKNLELGYTFDLPLLRQVGIRQARVYFQATNLLTITSLENKDPEKASSDMRGDMHPNTKSISFGVNVNF